MVKNRGLHQAKRAKKDEFYTQRRDVENELDNYKQHFAGKTVYCNCDDPRVSEFFRYFSYRFDDLKLKKVIATSYKNQSPDMLSKNDAKEAIYIEYKRNGNGELIPYPDYMKLISQPALYANIDNPNIPQPDDIGIGKLKGFGDFRSDECIELLKQADIVVTNPPFSLFSEYIAQLVKYDKKFVIVGHQNAITYKEVFKLIKENKVWLGYGFAGGAGHFISDYEDHATASDRKEGMIRVSGVNWFTNLEIPKRNEELILYKKYTPEKYPKYENYDAINVDITKHIPADYPGAMGVPVSFLDKYNPDQFELIWATDRGGDGMLEHLKLPHSRYDAPVVNGKGLYKRILIRNKKPLK